MTAASVSETKRACIELSEWIRVGNYTSSGRRIVVAIFLHFLISSFQSEKFQIMSLQLSASSLSALFQLSAFFFLRHIAVPTSGRWRWWSPVAPSVLLFFPA